MMKKNVFLRSFAALLLLAFSVTPALAVEVLSVRFWDAPDSTRVVFDVDKHVNYNVFALQNPNRLVVDLSNSRLASDLPDIDAGHGLLKGIRGARHSGDLRIVLDLKKTIVHRSFLLKPNDAYGHRLVIDLEDPGAPEPMKAVAQIADEPRDLVIAIDAGHGGEDPGARGRHGTHEKDVVLNIARSLARLVDGEVGMRAVMIREGDYYLSLRERIEKARQNKADLFISIHADAFKSPQASGSSVYVLSSKGASDEASRWLAERENAADLVGGVRLGDKDDVLASVLLDLSLTGTIEASTRAAERVLAEIRRVAPVHKESVQYAGFVVLKSPDIPSMLVETAFISNPHEERKLRNARYQHKLALAVLQGVKNYFVANPVPGTLLASGDRKHVIRRGDTLSRIAEKYQVSLGDLRVANQLSDDTLQVGQTLQIP